MSNAGTSQQAPRGGGALTVLRTELGAMLPEIQNALPAHISKEKFGRVAMTAIQGNPELLEVDRRSVWKACLQAAQDGLLPDGKEGAIVVRWSPKGKMAAWQPMIAGVRKKAQNAGLISTWDVDAVYANDEFEYEKGDNPFIRHKPALTNRGALVAAYSIATLKDGSKRTLYRNANASRPASDLRIRRMVAVRTGKGDAGAVTKNAKYVKPPASASA